MKQYMTVLIVFIVCLLSIIAAWIYRLSPKDKKINIETLDENIQINSTRTVSVYEENINQSKVDYNKNLNTSEKTDNNSELLSANILTIDSIKANEGNNKSYEEVKDLMLKYVKNGASLNVEVESQSEYLKIEYKVALDISKSPMKLSEPETSVNEYIDKYLEDSRTYNIEMNSEGNNIVNITITGN